MQIYKQFTNDSDKHTDNAIFSKTDISTIEMVAAMKIVKEIDIKTMGNHRFAFH